MSYYPLPSGLFRDNLHWLGDFARLLKVQFTRNEGMSNDAPIHECESWIDHYTGHYVPYCLRRVRGFFNVPQICYMCNEILATPYPFVRGEENWITEERTYDKVKSALKQNLSISKQRSQLTTNSSLH